VGKGRKKGEWSKCLSELGRGGLLKRTVEFLGERQAEQSRGRGVIEIEARKGGVFHIYLGGGGGNQTKTKKKKKKSVKLEKKRSLKQIEMEKKRTRPIMVGPFASRM